ncbi:MAG: protein BatD [Paludibacteraceae bacterium]|nr:protein BatD [Paludibacteraceae bacterium]MBR5470476.1 protein BatD [Paludibacteraceae bacterium]
MKKYLFLTLLLLTTIVKAEDVVFTATAPDAVANGQTFQLVYSVNTSAKELRIPEISDFDIVAGPFQSKSSSTQIINGNITHSTSLRFTYTLLPKKEGSFSIPAATIMVDKQKYSSNTLTIKVLPAEEDVNHTNNAENTSSKNNAITNDNLFIRAIVSRKNVYEQEYVLVTYKIYTRIDLVNIDKVKFPDFKDFLVQEIELPKDKQFALENYNGKNYNTITLRQVLLYPQRAGSLNIDKMTCDAIVRVRNTGPSRSIFDDFFDSYQEIVKPISTNTEKIEVKTLPEGKPSGFSGAAGTFTLSSSINKKELSANESVTIKLKISGNGNIKLLKNPEVKFPADFEVYDPKVENNFTNTTSGVTGTKTIEYLAIPRHSGTFTIPPVEFSYFDTNSKTYKTLKSEAFSINVTKASSESENGDDPVVNNFTNKESVKVLGSDIRHISMNDFSLEKPSPFFFGTWGFALAYIIPLIIIAFIFWFFRKQAKENSDIIKVRNKKANKMARKRLRTAEKFLKEQKKEEFYSEVLKAIWGYLCDKLTIPQAQLNKDNVEVELRKYSLEESIIQDFIKILNECEFAQYAPGENIEARDNLFSDTMRMITLLEEQIKK